MGTSFRFMLLKYFKNIFDENEIYMPNKHNGNTNLVNANERQLLEQTYDLNNKKVILAHCNYNELNVTSDFSKKCFSIVCVREPIDRFISHYYYFSFKETNKPLFELSEEELDKYIDNYGNLLTLRLSGGTKNYKDAIKNIRNIDSIILLEDLNAGLKNLNEKLNKNTGQNIKLEEEKKNVQKSKREELDKERMKLKSEKLKDDINLYKRIKKNA